MLINNMFVYRRRVGERSIRLVEVRGTATSKVIKPKDSTTRRVPTPRLVKARGCHGTHGGPPSTWILFRIRDKQSLTPWGQITITKHSIYVCRAIEARPS